jgi:hypothetical protein
MMIMMREEEWRGIGKTNGWVGDTQSSAVAFFSNHRERSFGNGPNISLRASQVFSNQSSLVTVAVTHCPSRVGFLWD